MTDFQVPSCLPFLTEEYVQAYAWYPAGHVVSEERPEFMTHRLWEESIVKAEPNIERRYYYF